MKSQKFDKIQAFCNALSAQATHTFRHVTLRIIVHYPGQLADALLLEEDRFLQHPAGENARRMLTGLQSHNLSGFVGVALGADTSLMRGAQRGNALGLAVMNIDEYADMQQVSLDAHRMLWHAVMLADLAATPEYRAMRNNGMVYSLAKGLALSRRNLTADIFSALATYSESPAGDAIPYLAMLRTRQVFQTQVGRTPEKNPFPLAMEATNYAAAQVLRHYIRRDGRLYGCWRLADDVASVFEDDELQHWRDFAKGAQQMAWRGEDIDSILGVSVYTSANPLVRTAALLASEILGKTPQRPQALDIGSPFATPETNAAAHLRLMEHTFERAITQAEKSGDSWALMEAARLSNDLLLRGHTLGWCAGALIGAALSFEESLRVGKPPVAAARLDFQGRYTLAQWSALAEFATSLMEWRREGHEITAEFALSKLEGQEQLRPVWSALRTTHAAPPPSDQDTDTEKEAKPLRFASS